jgi:hypothetical protein
LRDLQKEQKGEVTTMNLKSVKSSRTLVALLFVLPAISATALLCNAQDPGKPKPNIAVSGCLMREGYGTVVLANATVDAVGDPVSGATPDGAKPDAQAAPSKWVLDHPGPAGQHVGEKVQIIGVSSWVGAKASSKDEPPTVPHIDVQSFKILAGSCS